MPGQFVYRNRETGATAEFDHEPTEQELDTHFAGSTQSGTPATSPVSPQAPGLLQSFLTKVGAPMAGFAIGGLAGGPPGAALGATAGKAYGDLYNMGTGGEIPDPLDETMGLAAEGVGAFAGAHAAPLLQKLPGPPALKNIGFGAVGGAGIGSMTGHPGLGTAVGAGLGAYGLAAPMLRGVGKLSEFLTTPMGAAAEEVMSPAAQKIIRAAQAAGANMEDPTLKEMIARANQSAGPQSTAPPSRTPTFDALGQSAVDRIKSLFERVPPGADEQNLRVDPRNGRSFAGDSPRRQSTEVPYSANDAQLPNSVKARPSSFDMQQEVPRAVGGYPKGVRPDLTRNAAAAHAADVELTGDWKPDNLQRTSPTDPEFDWADYAGTTNPKRTGTGGSNYKVQVATPSKGIKMSATPDAAMEGLESAFGPNTVGAAQQKETKIPSGRDPAMREYPPGIDKTNATASEWIPEWNDYYNEAMGDSGVSRIQAALSALLNRKPGG